jgi:hypothetical protein
LGIVEDRPTKLFNLADDFEGIEHDALSNDGKRFNEVIRNAIRAINPIFSGDVDVALVP